MTPKQEAMLRQLLKTMEGTHPGNMNAMAQETWDRVIRNLREALAEQPRGEATLAQQEPVAPAMPDEIALIEKTAKSVGMVSLLNHGAASCVYSEGCAGVTQDHLLAYTREVALHCVAALWQPAPTQPQPVRELASLTDAPEIVQRVMRFSGKKRSEVLSPNITARECIELADWISAHGITPSTNPPNPAT